MPYDRSVFEGRAGGTRVFCSYEVHLKAKLCGLFEGLSNEVTIKKLLIGWELRSGSGTFADRNFLKLINLDFLTPKTIERWLKFSECAEKIS